jgi:hypothetical protein
VKKLEHECVGDQVMKGTDKASVKPIHTHKEDENNGLLNVSEKQDSQSA